jgi:hypothetical protein
VATQLAEQLLQVGQRNLLAPADGGQRDGTGMLPQREIDHGGHGKAAFGGQTH